MRASSNSLRKGLTLLEVLITIFVMGIGMLAVLTLFPLAAKKISASIDMDRASQMAANAAALADAYNRRTWYRFTAVFFPIPFVLVLLRLQVDYWHYYVFGSAYVLFAALLYAYDRRAADRCKAAEQDAAEAQRMLEEMRSAS